MARGNGSYGVLIGLFLFFFLGLNQSTDASGQEPDIKSSLPSDSGQSQGEEKSPSPPVPPQEPKGEPPPPVLFSLKEFKVEGSTLLSQEKIDILIAPFLGDQKGFADIEKARGELEKAYHEAGFPTVLVIVPEQTIENQSVRMEVFEGKLDQIEVTGNRYFSTRHILKKLPSLKVNTVPYEPDVEKELAAANLNPDLFISPVLSPGDEQGKISLLLNVKDRLPLHGSIEWNNKQTPNTQKNRLEASIQYSNLFDKDQTLTLNTVQSPDEFGKVQVYGLNYVAPLSNPDYLLMFYVNRSESGSVLPSVNLLGLFQGDIVFNGNSTISGIRYQLPLNPTESESHQLSMALEYKQIGPTTAIFPDPLGTALVSNPVNYTPLTLTYIGSKFDFLGSTTVTLTVKWNHSGMVGWGGKSFFEGDPSDPDMPGNRNGSTGNFIIFQGGSEIRRNLPKGFELWLKGNGQVATEPLISAEEFFAGGVDSVRGYLENEAPGDEGLRGSLELVTPRLPPLIDNGTGKSTEEIHLSTFIDTAHVIIKNPSPGQTDHFDLEGVGIGLKFKRTENFQISFNQAWALQDSIVTRKKDLFFHFSAKLLF
jgi:hemolysin activation/secretion protein